MGLPMGRRFGLHARLLGSIPSSSIEKSGKGAFGSTPVLGTGGFWFESRLPDYSCTDRLTERLLLCDEEMRVRFLFGAFDVALPSRRVEVRWPSGYGNCPTNSRSAVRVRPGLLLHWRQTAWCGTCLQNMFLLSSNLNGVLILVRYANGERLVLGTSV